MGFVDLIWPFWKVLNIIKTYSHIKYNVQISLMAIRLAENDIFGSNVHFSRLYTYSGVPIFFVHPNKCTERIGVKNFA